MHSKRGGSEICDATHNPGQWPYIARCTRRVHTAGGHRDKFGNIWFTAKEEEQDG